MRLKGSAILVTLLIAAIYLAAATRPFIHTISAQARQQTSPPPVENQSQPQPPASVPASPSAPPAPADGGVSNSGPPPAHAGDEQGKLGAEMGALGEQQGKLGQQQGELGRQQADLAQKATRAMKELLDDAIKRGIAQPEPQEPGSASF